MLAALSVAISLPAIAADRTADAKTFVTQLSTNHFDVARKSFDPVMLDAMDQPALEKVWKSLGAQVGAFKSIDGSRTLKQGAYQIFLVRTSFERGVLDVKVVYDDDGKIAGLFFVPSGEPADYGIGKPAAPPANVHEEKIVVGEGTEWPLPATLSLPADAKGKVPGVVLVHGSGPNDRDEAVGNVKPFRDLAWGLSSRGIAVLRYEKRTREHGSKMTGNITVKEETIDDAVIASALLRARPEVDPARVFVLGHSLGGYLAPRIGARDSKLAGLIVLAGPTRPLEDLIVEQTHYMATLHPVTDEEQKKLDELTADAAKVKKLDAKSTERILGVPASYWFDLKGYDPVADAAKLKMPMLIMQGGRDYQVTEADFKGWKKLASDKRITLKWMPELNHLFVTGTGKSRPEEYVAVGHVAEPAIDAIADWAKAH